MESLFVKFSAWGGLVGSAWTGPLKEQWKYAHSEFGQDFLTNSGLRNDKLYMVLTKLGAGFLNRFLGLLHNLMKKCPSSLNDTYWSNFHICITKCIKEWKERYVYKQN